MAVCLLLNTPEYENNLFLTFTKTNKPPPGLYVFVFLIFLNFYTFINICLFSHSFLYSLDVHNFYIVLYVPI